MLKNIKQRVNLSLLLVSIHTYNKQLVFSFPKDFLNKICKDINLAWYYITQTQYDVIYTPDEILLTIANNPKMAYDLSLALSLDLSKIKNPKVKTKIQRGAELYNRRKKLDWKNLTPAEPPKTESFTQNIFFKIYEDIN